MVNRREYIEICQILGLDFVEIQWKIWQWESRESIEKETNRT